VAKLHLLRIGMVAANGNRCHHDLNGLSRGATTVTASPHLIPTTADVAHPRHVELKPLLRAAPLPLRDMATGVVVAMRPAGIRCGGCDGPRDHEIAIVAIAVVMGEAVNVIATPRRPS